MFSFKPGGAFLSFIKAGHSNLFTLCPDKYSGSYIAQLLIDNLIIELGIVGNQRKHKYRNHPKHYVRNE